MLDEGLVHVPMIISWPGHVAQGIKSDALVELVDIAPTLAALLEVALPGATGKPFVGILSFDPGQYRRHRPERKP